jgi:hypothetical protein
LREENGSAKTEREPVRVREGFDRGGARLEFKNGVEQLRQQEACVGDETWQRGSDRSDLVSAERRCGLGVEGVVGGLNDWARRWRRGGDEEWV